jgi:hypothetical protein
MGHRYANILETVGNTPTMAGSLSIERRKLMRFFGRKFVPTPAGKTGLDSIAQMIFLGSIAFT